ncbi:RNA polymerase sigma factor RpoS [Thalassoglobus neptunius]|uniref:RNA polymerase sigma factor RpoS n=1 Tax=Thalassoglobus neptunius TaxID=1938619 RepID=A0A5C5X6F6_9PLAN|nr:sigma-70 family RNA polymerase sigma factor [Thalassoglobus neptunius]TWT58358.1 RNA polymerase sigma factor RpoS [Thalassoglobus neptunius]
MAISQSATSVAPRSRKSPSTPTNPISFIDHPDFEKLTESKLQGECPESLYDATQPPAQLNEQSPTTNRMIHQLLTPTGEAFLFKKMNFMKFKASRVQFDRNDGGPNPSAKARYERFLEESKKARSAIVEANLRLVASIAQKFARTRNDFEDLVSEGNMILVNAVDKFDYSRGFRFSTYATHAIQRHYYRVMQRQQRRQNREVNTSSEILGDVVPSRDLDAPLDHKIADALIDHFEQCLDEREMVIIRERFGLNEEQSSETLKSVAKKVGLSKERVRQLQMNAIEKLQDLALKLNLRLEPTF